MERTNLKPMVNMSKTDKQPIIGSFVAADGKRFLYTYKNREQVRLRFNAYARALYH